MRSILVSVFSLVAIFAAENAQAFYCSSGWVYDNSGSTVTYAGSDCAATANVYCSSGWVYNSKGSVAYIGSDCASSLTGPGYCDGGWLYDENGNSLSYVGGNCGEPNNCRHVSKKAQR